MSDSDDPYIRLRDSLVAAAQRQELAGSVEAPRSRRPSSSRLRRPFMVVALVLGLTGTAAAGIVVSQNGSKGPTTALDRRVVKNPRPASSNLRQLTENSRMYSRTGTLSQGVNWRGSVYGTTFERGPVEVDVLTDRSANVCFGSRTGSRFQGGSCARLPIPARRIPFEGGQDDQTSWVTAFAPDGVETLTGTTQDGTRARADFSDNVAVVHSRGHGPFVRVAWTTPNGKRLTQNVAR